MAALGRQARAAHLAEASVADRIAALERYAAEVGEAEAAYRDWTQAAAVAASGRQHLDMLARTAADEHGVAEIEDLSRRARAVRRAFGGPPARLGPTRPPWRRRARSPVPARPRWGGRTS